MLYIILTLIISPLFYFFILFRTKDAPERILVIQTAKIGDMVCATPVFSKLRETFPKAYIAALINPQTKGVIANNPHIDKIIPLKSERIKGFNKFWTAIQLRDERFDVCLILLPNVPNILISFWALIPRRILIYPENAGFTFKFCSIFASGREIYKRGELVSRKYIDSLKYIGIKPAEVLPQVFSTLEGDKKIKNFMVKHNLDKSDLLIGISISCGAKMKEWGRDKFISLSAKIIEKYPAKIIFMGSEPEREGAQEVMSHLPGKAINSCGEFSLEEVPSMLKNLKLFIGVDTGLVYMAAAAGTPVVDIAGPADISAQYPRGAACEIIQKDLPCSPCSTNFSVPGDCGTGDRKCLELITAEEVMERVVLRLEVSSL